ncbi:hypothetical protein G6F42_027230 [Rhizopus arrhizus]|nr:hypothetical protein G6F42_027230 [Rhizopus arrhizus]
MIDLTSSQPKRSKNASESPIAPEDTFELPQEAFMDMYEADFIDDSELPDEDFDDAAYEDNLGEEEDVVALANDKAVENESDFFPIDEDEIMDLDNIATSSSHQSTREELEMIMDTLKEKQNEINNSIVEGLSRNASLAEQKALMDERAELVQEISDLQNRIDNLSAGSFHTAAEPAQDSDCIISTHKNLS